MTPVRKSNKNNTQINLQKSQNKNKEEYRGNQSVFDLLFGLSNFNECLCSLEELPPHLQFNISVLKGYRRLSKLSHCFFSLFSLHNETWNILSHLYMALYTLIYCRTFWPWDSLGNKSYFYGLGFCHSCAMLVPWIPSCLYHTFMCHKGGSRVYDTLLTIDVLGIWMTEFFGSLTNISASVWLLPEGLQGALVGIYVVMSFFGLVQAMRARNPHQRVLAFSPLIIGRCFSIALRVSPYGGGNPAILHHVILQDILSIVGGLIGAARLPERWIPGRCDYFLNSHNIMHVLVILAVLSMNKAANGDIQWIFVQEQK